MGLTVKDKHEKPDEDGRITYRFDFSDPVSGKRYSKQKKCLPELANQLYRKWLDSLLDNVSGKHRFFEKLDEYLSYSEKTKSKNIFLTEKSVIEKAVKKFFRANMLLSDLNRGHAENYAAWRKHYILAPSYSRPAKMGYVKDGTVNGDLAVLSYFFNYCIKRQYCNYNPFSMTKMKVNNYREINLSKEQIELLIEKSRDINDKFHNMIQILLMSGMRKGELFELTWSKVDFQNSMILLSAYKTKSKKRRVIPITPRLREILLSLTDNKVNEQNEFVISNYGVAKFRNDWHQLLKVVNLKTSKGEKLHVHDLRHVFAQSLLNEGVQLEDIQTLLGHADFGTTQKRYAQFARPDLLEKASKIDKILQ